MEKKSIDVAPRSEMADNTQRGSIESISNGKALPKGHDIALELFGGHVDDFEFSAKEANWVRWKLDLILLPLMTITYVLNYMDKVALSEASIFGIRKDLHLVGNQYSWSSSIFYLGYLVWQYSSSVLMQKLPIGRYFGAMVIFWGIVATTTVSTTSFTTLAINRVFLGVFETCMSPILTILVGQYWTRKEQPFRASLWWTGSAIGAFIADAITYALSGSSKTGKYAVWQMVYLVFGPITIAWGIVLFLTIPTSPMTAWFLTEREKKIAVKRVLANHTGIQNREYKWHQVRECLKDTQVWILVSIVFLQCLQAGGLTAFNKIVLMDLGYSQRKATLMSMPSNAIHLVSVVIGGAACSYFKNIRILVMILTNTIVLTGAILINKLPENHKMSRLASFYILYVNTVSTILAISLVSSNIGGFTKKSTASVMIFVGFCVGQFCGPQFFKSSEAPGYATAFNAIFASVTIMIALQIALAGYLTVQNRRRDRTAAAAGNLHSNNNANHDLLDLTDWEMKDFRYVL